HEVQRLFEISNGGGGVSLAEAHLSESVKRGANHLVGGAHLCAEDTEGLLILDFSFGKPLEHREGISAIVSREPQGEAVRIEGKRLDRLIEKLQCPLRLTELGQLQREVH